MNSDVLIIHGSRCPLNYCKDVSSLSDPSVQCDFNRNGTLCGLCRNNFSIALDTLHCIPCDNNHTALIVLFALAGVALITIYHFSPSTYNIFGNTKWPILLCQYCSSKPPGFLSQSNHQHLYDIHIMVKP